MLRIDDRGRVRVLTLDRPDALNAFDNPLYRAASEALRDASADRGVACVIVTGAGRAFSAGQDLAEMRTIDPAGGEAEEHGFATFFRALSTFDKPLLAAVNGVGVGIGLTLLLHADLVIMADHARVRAPFTALGVVPEAASSLLLPLRVGDQHAAHALFTSSWIDAEAALATGLAWRVVPAGELLDTALAVGAEIAAMPISSLVATKRLLLAARADAVAAANRREQAEFQQMLGRPANVEAITAFLEKRPPNFADLPDD
jgi:enoyl-CoA hydratase/carnithine racemase